NLDLVVDAHQGNVERAANGSRLPEDLQRCGCNSDTHLVGTDLCAAMSAWLEAERTSESTRTCGASVAHVDQPAQCRDVLSQGLASGAGQPNPRRTSPRPDTFAA